MCRIPNFSVKSRMALFANAVFTCLVSFLLNTGYLFRHLLLLSVSLHYMLTGMRLILLFHWILTKRLGLGSNFPFNRLLYGRILVVPTPIWLIVLYGVLGRVAILVPCKLLLP